MYSLELLPNWWFSLAIACFLGHQDLANKKKWDRQGDGRTSSGHDLGNKHKHKKDPLTPHSSSFVNTTDPTLFYTLEHAAHFLTQAILAWPTVYLSMIQELCSSSSALKKDISSIQNHPKFQNFLNSIK